MEGWTWSSRLQLKLPPSASRLLGGGTAYLHKQTACLGGGEREKGW